MADTNEFTKYASEGLDYMIDWAARLGADTIGSAVWAGDSGITVGASSNTTTTTTVRISGGTTGETYEVWCDITTAAGFTMREVLRFIID